MKVGDEMRIFIGIPLPKDFVTYVNKKQEDLKPFISKGKLTHQDNLHLTLLFIGEMDQSHIEHLNRHLTHDLTREKSFSISTSSLGSFNKKSEHILWIGIEEGIDELTMLAKKVKQSTSRADIAFKSSDFTPHITIARNVIFNTDFSISRQNYTSYTLLVDTIHLYLSHQVEGRLTYTKLYTYRLQ